jgi:hypothetical protein
MPSGKPKPKFETYADVTSARKSITETPKSVMSSSGPVKCRSSGQVPGWLGLATDGTDPEGLKALLEKRLSWKI